MRSKEDFISNKGEAWEYSNKLEVSPIVDVYSAMDEYAKEVAIAFKKWKEDNYWADYYDEDNITPLQDVPRWSSNSVKHEMLTTEELYNLFISSQ